MNLKYKKCGRSARPWKYPNKLNQWPRHSAPGSS